MLSGIVGNFRLPDIAHDAITLLNLHMTLTTATWLAAATGLIAGSLAIIAGKRSIPQSSTLVLFAVIGAALAAIGLWVFLIPGFVLSMMFFSGPTDPAPALLCLILVELAWLAFVLVVPPEWLKLVKTGDPTQGFDIERLLAFPPAGGTAKMWIIGVGVALIPAIYGVQCVITGTSVVGGTLWHRNVTGLPALALGLGWIGAGAFVHFHYFFGLHPKLEPYSRTGKTVSLVVACIALATAFLLAIS